MELAKSVKIEVPEAVCFFCGSKDIEIYSAEFQPKEGLRVDYWCHECETHNHHWLPDYKPS